MTSKTNRPLKELKKKTVQPRDAAKVRGGAIKGSLGGKQKSWNPANF